MMREEIFTFESFTSSWGT